jgi:hypothetical protein
MLKMSYFYDEPVLTDIIIYIGIGIYIYLIKYRLILLNSRQSWD